MPSIHTEQSNTHQQETTQNVVASVSESEIGGDFENIRYWLHLQRIVIALKHPQLPTLKIKDNTTANGIYNNTSIRLKPRQMHMRNYWLQKRI